MSLLQNIELARNHTVRQLSDSLNGYYATTDGVCCLEVRDIYCFRLYAANGDVTIEDFTTSGIVENMETKDGKIISFMNRGVKYKRLHVTASAILATGCLNDDEAVMLENGTCIVAVHEYATEWSDRLIIRAFDDVEKALDWYASEYRLRLDEQATDENMEIGDWLDACACALTD